MSDQTQAAAATETPWPPTTMAWYAVIVLAFSNMVSLMDRMVLSFLTPAVIAEFSLTDTQVSLLTGFAFAVVYCSFGLPVARVADSKTRKYIVIACITVWSAMTALCGAAAGYWQLFLARMGVGAGSAGLSPSAYSMMSDYFPPQKLALPMGVFSMGVTVGMGMAFIFGGAAIAYVAGLGDVTIPLLGTLSGWRLVLVIMGALGIPLIILMATVKEPPRRGAAAVKADPMPFSQIWDYITEHWKVYLLIMGGYGCTSISIYGILNWTTSFYGRVHGLTGAEGMAYAGFLIGTAAIVGGIIGSFTGGVLADWLESKGDKDAKTRVLLIGCIGLIPPGILAPLMPSPELAATCLCFTFIFGSIATGPTGSLVQIITPARMRAQMGAIYQMALNLIGLGLGPTFVAVMTDFVFRDSQMVGYSLIASVVLFDGLAVLLTFLGFRHYRKVRDQVAAAASAA